MKWEKRVFKGFVFRCLGNHTKFLRSYPTSKVQNQSETDNGLDTDFGYPSRRLRWRIQAATQQGRRQATAEMAVARLSLRSALRIKILFQFSNP